MTRLTRLALDHPSITILLVVLLFVVGMFAARALNQELIPDIAFPQASVVTVYPGASADVMTEDVTRPIERALEATEDVDVVEVSSRTSESVSIVTLRTEYGTDQDALRDAVAAQLTTLQLPESAEEPEIVLFDFGDVPVVAMSASGDIEPDELQRLVEAEIVPELESVDGVAEVTVDGVQANKIYVTVDPQRMARYGVTLERIQGVLRANNLSIPAGTLKATGESVPLQVSNRISTVEQLRSLALVPAGAGAPAGPGAPAGAAGGPPTGQGAESPGPGGAAGAPSGAAAAPVPPAEPDARLSALWQAFGANLPTEITPDVLRVAEANVPEAVDELTPGQLLALPPESAAALPERVLAAQSMDVRDALEANAAGSAGAAGAEAGAGAAGVTGAVTLGDVATVEEAPEDASTISRTNGQPALGVSVFRETDANTVSVVDDVLERVEELEDEDVLGEVDFDVVFEQGSYIEESLDGVTREGLLGALFAVLVILVFLHFSVRATLVTAISIPLSVVFGLLLMRMSGLTLNLLTLSGLTIAIGRIVDDAIVVTENIFRHLQRGDNKMTAVVDGTREVTTAITASTLVTVAVFLPLGFIGGITREFFGPFGLTATYALLASLLVAVTIVPVLASYFLARGNLPDESESRLKQVYARTLEWALDHRGATLAASLIFFVLSLGLLGFIPRTFLPDFGEPTLSVVMSLPPGTDLATSDEVAREVEAVIQDDPDIETVQTTVGSSGLGQFGQSAGSDTSEAFIVATFRSEEQGFFEKIGEEELDTDEVADRIRDDLSSLEAATPITFTVSTRALGGPGGQTFDLEIRSADEEALREANSLVMAALLEPENWKDEGWLADLRDEDEDPVVPLINLESNLTAARNVLSVDVDPSRALARGLTTAQVAAQVRSVIEGQSFGEVQLGGEGEEGRAVEVIARYPAGSIESSDALEDYTITGPAGPVRIGDIATVTERPGPVQITRVDGERAAVISGEITEDDTFGVMAGAQRIVDDLELDDRFGEDVVEVGSGVQSSMQQEGFGDMAVALVFSIFIVYGIMVVTFRSIVHPFTILFSLPFAFSGAFLALALTGRPLSISGMIGLLMLVGIVVTNAIVLVDLVQQYRARGMDVRTALVRGGSTRLRPILMTAIATVLALIPQALGLSGEGALIASDLATTVIGGLLTSTFLTLIVVPVVYSLLDRLTGRRAEEGLEYPPLAPQDRPGGPIVPAPETT